MSLTSMLKKDINCLKLFSAIPSHQNIVKTYHSTNGIALIPQYKSSNLNTVDLGFNYWCRAFIQKLNEIEIEITIPKQILSGIMMAAEYNLIKEKDINNIMENIEYIWKYRSDYINGKEVNQEKLLQGCLVLANCEKVFKYRESGKSEKGVLTIKKDDLVDLRQIVEKNKKTPRMFKTKYEIQIKPSFGEFSKLVGGSDADYILGNMLVNIETKSQYLTFKKDFRDELLGYYLLSTFDNNFLTEIKQIGVLYPRFNTLKFINIEDVRRMINLDKFSYYFKKIVENESQNFNDIPFQKLKKEINI